MESIEPVKITLDDVKAAADRIRSRIRHTPSLKTNFCRTQIHPNLILKLECLQVTGSFKARGANNAVLSLSNEEVQRGIITASGGNHGIAVAYAGYTSNANTVIYLPKQAAKAKIASLKNWGAEVVLVGEFWDEANAAALDHAKKEKMTYIHPFADPRVIAGQATIAYEMLSESPHIDTIVAGIGGGGLISGVALAAKAMKPEIRIIGVEPVGAPTLKTSVKLNAVTVLDQINTQAMTLAPKQSAAINLDLVTRLVDGIVLVNDENMREASGWLFEEMGIAAELSGAAALAALQTGLITVPANQTAAAIVCGRGFDGKCTL